MRIDRLDVYHVRMPLNYPWRTGHGEDPDIHSVLVRASAGEHSAWVESSPLQAPEYSPECAGTVFYLLKEFFGPYVVGRDYESAPDVLARLARFSGNPFAKGALELCWWALQRAITGTPLHRLLGGPTREVAAGADIQVQDSLDILLQKVQEAVDAGFPRIKLKARRGWDLAMMSAVRDAFPRAVFHMDFNARYTRDDLPLFKALDRLQLAFFEQPLAFEDLLGAAELRRQIATPICLDEAIRSPVLMEQAIRLGACDYVNVKPARLGGLSACVRVHDLCREAGIKCWVGGMIESALGEAICVELATLENFVYPADIFPSARFYAPDLCEPAIELTPRVTFAPYLGSLPAPNPERLARQTVQYAAVAPA
ncbi:MAG: o-succinylbenzoate synthase [Actinobacteria bacterium]|nr:o-succinylbenzoate synthase [Actinomycetota bacterium]